MIIDAENLLSTDQAVTTSAASTNVIDLGVGDKGITEYPMRVVVNVSEAVTAAGAATVTFVLETDDNAAFSSAKTAWSSAAIPKAELGINTIPVNTPLPIGMEQFMRLTYTVGTGPLTAGKFSAALVSEGPKNVQYPDARTFA